MKIYYLHHLNKMRNTSKFSEKKKMLSLYVWNTLLSSEREGRKNKTNLASK